jgi:hypothetical protein
MVEDETGLAAETGRAMRELARTVTDAPPLRLAPVRAARAAGPAGRRRWTLWAVPLTAAVAVIALAVALVTIKDLPNGRVVPPIAPASSSAAGVPAYYAAPEILCRTCESTRLVVGDTFTGAKLATFSPPRGTVFEAVSAAADDRTFVADTVGYPSSAAGQRVTWYLLKITPGAQEPARLTRLRIPNTPSSSLVGAIALSPSGSELAVTYRLRRATPPTAELRIYSVATGKLLNSWSITTGNAVLSAFDFEPYTASNNLLSWVDGGRAVSFPSVTYALTPAPTRFPVDVAVRAVNVSARGGELIRDSRVVWSAQFSETNASCADGYNMPLLAADGKTVVCAEGDNLSAGVDPSGKREAFPLAWLAYQTSQPTAARTLYATTAYTTGTYPGCLTSVQWADPAGTTLIVAWSAKSTRSSSVRFGVISHGRFTPLPTPPGITVASPPDIAW